MDRNQEVAKELLVRLVIAGGRDGEDLNNWLLKYVINDPIPDYAFKALMEQWTRYKEQSTTVPLMLTYTLREGLMFWWLRSLGIHIKVDCMSRKGLQAIYENGIWIKDVYTRPYDKAIAQECLSEWPTEDKQLYNVMFVPKGE